MFLKLGISLISGQFSKLKDLLFANLHTEAAENLVQEDGGYLELYTFA